MKLKSLVFVPVVLTLLLLVSCGGAFTPPPASGVSSLSSITLTPQTTSVEVGATQQFQANPTDQYGKPMANVPLTFASSKPTVATINATGLAIGIAAGTSNITVAADGISASALLTVPVEAPVGISPATLAFSTTQTVGTSSTNTIAVTNEQRTPLTIHSITTSLADYSETNTCGSSLAAGAACTVTVVFTPAVAGSLPGTLTITDSAITSPQVVTLTGGGAPNNLVSLAITAPDSTLVTGSNEQLEATGTYANGTTGDVTAAAVWTSSNPAVATVGSSTGITMGVSAGRATISAAVTGTKATGTLSLTVAAPTLVSIALTAPTNGVAVGRTTQFSATGTYSNGTTAVLPASSTTFQSSNPSVASVTSAGLATGVAAGTAGITATSGTMTSPAVTLTVTGATLQSIAISPANPSLAKGTNLALTATGTYSDGSTQNLTTQVTWSSASAAVTVSNASASQGVVTGASVGSATVSAALATAPSVIGGTTVTVTAAALQSIAVAPSSPSVALGLQQQFTATGTYTDGTTQNITGTVTWSSSDTAMATISAAAGTQGQATALAQGSTNIVATSGSTSGSTTLTVGAAVLVSIAVTPSNPSIAVGTTEQFTATGTYSDNSTQNLTTSVTWSYATAGVATISNTTGSNGLATATTQGSRMITATSTATSVSGSTLLTVTAPVLTSITVTPATASLYQGSTDQFTATGTYSDGTTQTITNTVAWSAGDGTIATVSNSSPQGLATAIAGGTVQIVATFTPATGPAITSAATGGGGTLAVVALNSISVLPSTPTISLGIAGLEQFTATANFADGTTSDITAAATWTSSDLTIATIGNTQGTQGQATPVSVGAATITATYASVAGSTLLTISAATLESIAVTPASVSLGLNATQQYAATGTFSDGSTSDVTSQATWTSGDTAIVGVSSPGGLATVLGTSPSAVSIAASVTNAAGTLITSPPAWVSALSTLPIVCQGPTIDLRLLVVNNAEANSGAGYADFPAIQQILNYVGTPYDVVDVSAAVPTLSDGACHGYYQGVIFAYGGDYYNISAWQSALISYEQTFGVRQLNWYDTPDPNFGLSDTGTQIPDTQTYTTNFTAAAAPVFFYANTATPLTITNAAVDLATADPAAGGTLTPLLQDASGNIVSAIYTLNGQQFLSQTFDSNPSLTHDLVVAYGLLNWVTQGVFLGDYHVYATQSIDDFFIDDSEWIPSTTCLSDPQTLDHTAPDASNLPVFRVNSSDMAQLVAWQQTKQADPLLSQFELTIAFNGVGTSGNGNWTGLTAPIISSSAANGVATFTAQDFSGLVGQSVTVTNTTNGGGVLNGTWTIVSETSNAATTPGTTTFTANITSTATVTAAAEKGKDDNTATATATVADDLVANLQSYQQYFHWMSHTYDHPTTLNGLCKSSPTGTGCGDVNNSPATDDIDLEVLTNLWVASSAGGVNLDTDSSVGPHNDGALAPLTFTDFNPANIVTPGVTGLNDPNVPGYLYADGIRYAVSDTSVATTTDPPNNNGPNPSPNVGIVNSYEPGIYEVPRHPNDVFYNVANWADDQAEFDCVYSYYVAPGAPAGTTPAPDPPFNTYNAAQVLDFTSSAFVTNMLMGDMDPEMFHQPDLHFSDNYANLTNAAPSGTIPASVSSFLSTAANGTHVSSLLSDTYDLTISKYEALYNLPVRTPTLDQLGVLMQNRNSFNQAGVTASIVGAGTASATLSITMPSTATSPATAVIPVTGLTSAGSEVYGGQNISHINMTPGQTITFPLP